MEQMQKELKLTDIASKLLLCKGKKWEIMSILHSLPNLKETVIACAN